MCEYFGRKAMAGFNWWNNVLIIVKGVFSLCHVDPMWAQCLFLEEEEKSEYMF